MPVLAVWVLALPPGSAWAQPGNPVVTERLLVKPRPGAGPAEVQALLARYNARAIDRLSEIGVYVVELPPAVADTPAAGRLTADNMEADPTVAFAQVDRLLPLQELVPNDPYWSYAWHLRMMDLPIAWDHARGEGITVAILDTGMLTTHNDLAGQFVQGWNSVDGSSDYSDIQGHGTKVGGMVGALTHNATGVASVAFNARLMPIRVSNRSDGSAYTSDIARGLIWAADHGARVANISYNVSDSATVSSAAQYLWDLGGITLVAAGNAGTDPGFVDDPYIVSVAATNSNDVRSSFSNYGSHIDIAAPGQQLATTGRGGGYPTSVSGTSFSSPAAAAVAALVLSADPGLTPAEVEAALEQTAEDLGDPGWDPYYGHGRINAARAVQSVLDTSPPPPPPAPEELTALLSDVSIDANWSPISLPGMEGEPVVIAGVPGLNDATPGVVRLRNISADSSGTRLEARFENWDYLPQSHAAEATALLAVPAGRYPLEDGSVWEAGVIELDGNEDWHTLAFSQTFEGTPRLLLSVQTDNETDTVTVRARNVSPQGFEAALFEQDSNHWSHHAVERVGYLAIHNPTAGGEITVDGNPISYSLEQILLSHEPQTVAGAELFVQEEQSATSEQRHKAEQVDVLAIGAAVFGQDVSTAGGDTAALRRVDATSPPPDGGDGGDGDGGDGGDGGSNNSLEWGSISNVTDQWQTVTLSQSFSNPVVVANAAEQVDPEYGLIQIRNVAAGSFEMRFREWDYLDGIHGPEQVFYLVAEAGESTIGDLNIQAGTLVTDQLVSSGWVNVAFPQAFAQTPALFSGVMTANDGVALTTRIHGPGADGFNIAMQRQEYSSKRQGQETVGWIAISPGRVLTDQGQSLEVRTGLITDEQPLRVDFDNSYASPPAVLTHMNSTNGGDAAVTAMAGLDSTGVRLYVQEEQSANTEINHIDENLVIFAAD